jgi:hypothetical protein
VEVEFEHNSTTTTKQSQPKKYNTTFATVERKNSRVEREESGFVSSLVGLNKHNSQFSKRCNVNVVNVIN